MTTNQVYQTHGPSVQPMQITTRHIAGGYEATGWLVAGGDAAWREKQTLIFVDDLGVLRITGDRFDVTVAVPAVRPNGAPGWRQLTDHGMPSGLTHEGAVAWWCDALSPRRMTARRAAA